MEHCQTRSSVVQAPLEHQKGPKEPSSYKLDFERGAVNSLSTALGGDAPEAVARYPVRAALFPPARVYPPAPAPSAPPSHPAWRGRQQGLTFE